jgi:hypothetical protein
MILAAAMLQPRLERNATMLNNRRRWTKAADLVLLYVFRLAFAGAVLLLAALWLDPSWAAYWAMAAVILSHWPDPARWGGWITTRYGGRRNGA